MELFLAPVKLIISGAETVILVPDQSVYYEKPLIAPEITFKCHYQKVAALVPCPGVPVFSGESFEEAIIPYKWQIFKDHHLITLHITFFNHLSLLELCAHIDPKGKTIAIECVTRNNSELYIDPLFHPFGSLLMIYLAHFSGGMLIHASGIQDGGKGYLFTGVSGIGKSTMSRLWHEAGAEIINDDRLWLHKTNGKWAIFNTPMQLYAQEPFMVELSKAFLLQQTPTNLLTPIQSPRGALRLMANCIQHLYDKEMTTAHLNRLLDLTASIPVYELGFKPDTEVVELIRAVGNKKGGESSKQ
jgi:hypothetical protein